VSKAISASKINESVSTRLSGIRDRRYVLRYPFVANAELVDLDLGTKAEGKTSDISLGGCFICTAKPLTLKSRARVVLTHKAEQLEALVVVRIVKPRVGMGIEFIDLEDRFAAVLSAWIEKLRSKR
jgi:hypothetical protein